MSSVSSSDGSGSVPLAGPRRALILINPNSRRGDLATNVDGCLSILERSGIVLVRDTSERDGLSELILKHETLSDIDLVVIGGGDGTINAAAPALLETSLPLGILPLDTANDLARTLGIPADPAAAAAVIAAGHTRRIDIGVVNGHPFFNVASIGLSVTLARELTAERKRRWGRLAYAVAAIRALAQARRPFSADITREGGETVLVKTVQIAVGNGRYYGGGMAVWEDARIDDHCLDLYSLEVRSWWRLVFMALALRKGSQRHWRDVRGSCGGAIEIRTRRPKHVNAHGEIVTPTPAKFSQIEGAIQVFAPPHPPKAPGDLSPDVSPLRPVVPTAVLANLVPVRFGRMTALARHEDRRLDAGFSPAASPVLVPLAARDVCVHGAARRRFGAVQRRLLPLRRVQPHALVRWRQRIPNAVHQRRL